jgi:hypothetical protein
MHDYFNVWMLRVRKFVWVRVWMLPVYIYICKYILDFNIRDTCISIMECSEIERRTIPVEEEVAFPYIIISPQSISIVSFPCTLISPLSTSTTVDRFF